MIPLIALLQLDYLIIVLLRFVAYLFTIIFVVFFFFSLNLVVIIGVSSTTPSLYLIIHFVLSSQRNSVFTLLSVSYPLSSCSHQSFS